MFSNKRDLHKIYPFERSKIAKRDASAERSHFQYYYGINTALRLTNTNLLGYLYQKIFRYTNEQQNVGKICKHCGNFFINDKKTKFCSNKCSNRYFAKRREEMTMRLTMNAITNDEAKAFYKQWNNLAYSEIYKYPQYYEDLIACWHVKGLYILRFCKKQKMDFKHKNLIKVIKRFIKFHYIELERNRKHEVFYSECSFETQNKILGTSLEEI